MGVGCAAFGLRTQPLPLLLQVREGLQVPTFCGSAVLRAAPAAQRAASAGRGAWALKRAHAAAGGVSAQCAAAVAAGAVARR